jgi:hypothetical protein
MGVLDSKQKGVQTALEDTRGKGAKPTNIASQLVLPERPYLQAGYRMHLGLQNRQTSGGSFVSGTQHANARQCASASAAMHYRGWQPRT